MRRLILPCLLGTATAIAAPVPTPPPAPVHPVTDSYFGTTVVDNYRYMEDLKDPRVAQWMKAQADYTRATLDAIPGRAALRARFVELLHSMPELVGGLQIVADHYYTLRLPAGAKQLKLYVREAAAGADRLLIDPEKLPGGADGSLALQFYAPSPDNRYVAYTVAARGSEQGGLRILDIRTGLDLPETADDLETNETIPLTWRADGRSFFYTRRQALTPGMPATAKYQNEHVQLHVLGRAFANDTAVLGIGVASSTLPITESEVPAIVVVPGSRHAVAIIAPSIETRVRVYATPADSIQGGEVEWRPIAPSYDDEFARDANASAFAIALHGDTLYWLSRKDAPRGRILALDLANPGSQPRVVVAQGELPITDVRAAPDALYWRVNDSGVHAMHRMGYARGAKPGAVPLPYTANVRSVEIDPYGDAVVMAATSRVRSPTYLGYDVRTGVVAETGLQPAGRYDHAEGLVAEEVKVKSWDGTLVPLSIIYRKGLARDGSNPTILSGYGAYGSSSAPAYDPTLLALFERGVVDATCHVRGGGELGEAWHLAGFEATKPNTWRDFIACAEWLVANGYTQPASLAGTGTSAGGILIGRAIEERPDLFAAAVAAVPVADTLRSETTANGATNVAEFGSVKSEAGFRALLAMSPYANVKDGVKYPAVLVTTGMNDPRVDAWEPAKLAARLQAASASGKPVLLGVDYAGGHGFGSSIDQALDDATGRYAFMLWQTGHPDFQPTTNSAD